MNTVLTIFVVFIAAKLVAELILSMLNRAEVLKNKGQIPGAFQSVMDQATYDKSVEYTLAKNRFDQVGLVFDAIVLTIVILSGFLPWMYGEITAVVSSGLWGQSFAFLAMAFVLTIPSIPFDLWQQFGIEERFGFNKLTIGLWISDKIKGVLLGLAIGMPLLWVLMRFFQAFPNNWWLWFFGVLFVFQILALLLYPTLILPLFNKLKPLEDGELKDRLMKLAKRAGFAASTIEVMDGSKRSGHSNAFFTGFGRFRRIVLFDTLMEQLDPTELEAVLAHEIGHYKRGHIPQRLIISAVSTLAAFYGLFWLMGQSWFLTSFGFSADVGVAPALLLFMLLAGLVTFWVSPLMHALSRKHEYQADAFSADVMGSPDSIISSLHKLSEKNLSNLTPHPLYSSVYYSHPTLLERQRALRNRESS